MMTSPHPRPASACCLALSVLFWSAAKAEDTDSASGRPNVLFIAIDDMNDWIGHVGGHPMAKTPHLDRLAERGTSFLNAHCNAPLCNPSRTSLLMGLRPSTTGIYGLQPWFRTLPEWEDWVSLPQYFAQHGYSTHAAGKIYHFGTAGPGSRIGGRGQRTRQQQPNQPAGANGAPAEFQHRGPSPGVGVRPEEKLIPPTPMGNHPLMDWGVFEHRDEDKGDYLVASWAIEQIESRSEDQPFFVAAGFFLPHVPIYATQKWFDLYPDDDSVLPEIRRDERDNTPRFSWYLHWELPEPRLKWVEENKQWRNLVRSYLAATSFVDAQIGRLLDALEEQGLAENTVVVVWGDHGWHLGEKAITGKNTLWDRGTKVPLLFAGPGVSGGQLCTQPAELLDLYPTLVELAGLPARDGLEGLSLLPQLADASTPRERPAITSASKDNLGIRSEKWRYIVYADGSEELYDMENDPEEFYNLADQEQYADVIAEHRQWIPETQLDPAPGSAHRILTYDPETDEAEWEERITIKRGDPIPE